MHSFKPITFQELRSYLTPNPYISFRFYFMHTPQHRTASVVSFLSIPQAPFSQSLPKPFSNAFPAVCFIFCVELAPMERILLVLFWYGFFFQKDSKIKFQKDKYNKDFLSVIFTDKKIKNLAKIRRPTQTHALGSKGQALRVLRKNLHTYASFR
ncbi:MAG: hypothetical protein PHR83_07780 [Paludibacter sp.]|nr:hypothetical protein [Paludibacter sp.]